MTAKINRELLLSPPIESAFRALHFHNSRRQLNGLSERNRRKEEKEYNNARNSLFVHVSQRLGRLRREPPDPAIVAERVQENSLIFSLLNLYHYVTTHRLFPLLYALIVFLTITHSSVKIFYDIPVKQRTVWAKMGTATTIICDILEMAVLSTTLICNATTARTIIQFNLLPPMSICKVLGKFAKAEFNWTVVGECLGELMPVIGRFLAVINSHPAWQIAAKPVDVYCENQLTTEEELMVLGLAWDCWTPPRE